MFEGIANLGVELYGAKQLKGRAPRRNLYRVPDLLSRKVS